MTFFLFHWTFILIIPAFLITLYAQMRVKTTYKKYAQMPVSTGRSGADAVRQILSAEGINNVTIEEIPGELTDHYDPRSKILRLSSAVYRGRSVAALGIAAHEAGHAIQDYRHYLPLAFRNGIAPIVGFGQHLWYMLFMGAFFMFFITRSMPVFLIDIGIFVMTGVVIFQLVTLPVEFNASRRALVALTNGGLFTSTDEVTAARSVLRAASFTYLAATLMAILQLVRLITIRRSYD